jgi:hypothetical protein
MQFLFDKRNEFDPERIAKLTRAFEDALSSVNERDSVNIPALSLRRIMASGIIAEARRGENDPERLKKAALEALGPLGGAVQQSEELVAAETATVPRAAPSSP